MKTPTDISNMEIAQIHLYEPDLFAFDRHVRNQYALYKSELIDPDLWMPTLKSWVNFCYGVLVVYSQIQLSPLYRRLGVRTDSAKKLIVGCLNDVEIPRWLLDICREVTRPMVKDVHVYIPWIVARRGGSTPGYEQYGIGATQAANVVAWLKALKLPCIDFRKLGEEGILSTLLSVRDGKYIFVTPEIATWRKQAWYMLLHLRNAAPIPNSILPRPNRVWVPERVRSIDEPQTMVNEIDIPAQLPIPVGEVPAVALAILNGGEYRPAHGQARLVFFVSDDRPAAYHAWLARARTAGTTLPPPERYQDNVRLMLSSMSRFSTDDMHSKTPPQSPVRVDVLKSTRKRKAKKKTVDKTVEFSPTNVEASDL